MLNFLVIAILILSALYARLANAQSQLYKVFNERTIFLHFWGPVFENKFVKDIDVKLYITDEDIIEPISDFSILKGSKRDKEVVVTILPEQYYFPNLIFPQYLVLEDITLCNQESHFLSQPERVVKIYPEPKIDNATVKDENGVIIYGRNLIKVKGTYLRFDPYLVYGIDYEDVSSYPLTEDSIHLRIYKQPMRVNFEPSPLYLTHIDTGAGKFQLPEKICLHWCEREIEKQISPDLSKALVVYEARKEQEREKKMTHWWTTLVSDIIRFPTHMAMLPIRLLEFLARRVGNLFFAAREFIHLHSNFAVWKHVVTAYSCVSCSDLLFL